MWAVAGSRYERINVLTRVLLAKVVGAVSGCPLQDLTSGTLCLYMKGADSVMSGLVHYSDWLEEEVRKEGS